MRSDTAKQDNSVTPAFPGTFPVYTDNRYLILIAIEVKLTNNHGAHVLDCGRADKSTKL